MIRVLLDTNILRSEGMNSIQMQRLHRLVENKVIQLIIPEIVIEEYKSQISDLAQNELNKIKASIASLKRQDIDLDDLSLLVEEHSFSEEAQNQIDKIKLKIDSWVVKNEIEIYKISNTSIEELFKCYFSGTGAFRDKKNRDDIPDAVIYDAIINLSKKDDLLVVLKDKVLLSALQRVQKVKCFQSLKALLELDTLKESVLLIDKDDNKTNMILSLLEGYECHHEIRDHLFPKINEALDTTYYVDFLDLPFELSEIKNSNIEIQPRALSGEEFIQLTSPNYLGNNKFSLDLSVNVSAKLSLYCTEEEFEEIPFKIRKKLSKNPNIDERLHITGDIEAELEGAAIIESKINDFSNSQLKDVFLDLDANKQKMTCIIQISSIHINEYQ